MNLTELLVALGRLAGMGWGEVAILGGLATCLALATALLLPSGQS